MLQMQTLQPASLSGSYFACSVDPQPWFWFLPRKGREVRRGTLEGPGCVLLSSCFLQGQKAPAAPTPPLQWPCTHQGHLSIPSLHLARLKSSCLLCSNWGFACYSYLVQWNMTPRLRNPSSLGDNLGWLDIHSWHCSTLGAIFFHWAPSAASLLPSFPLVLVSKLQVVVTAAP